MDGAEVVEQVPTKFVHEPSSHLKCPLCKNLYKDPVTNIKCGHTFCRSCAFNATHCPLDTLHCDTSQLVVNRLVVGQIDDIEIYCQHGLVLSEDGHWTHIPDSCNEIISYGIRDKHEQSCSFATVSCPNSEVCSKVRKIDLENHLRTCTQTRCENHSKGCTYRGLQTSLGEHIKSCIFRDLGGKNGQLAQRLLEQESVVKQLRIDNSRLSGQVSSLLKMNKDMGSQIEKQSSLIHNLQQQMDALAVKVDNVSGGVYVKRPNSVSASQLSLLDGGTSTSSSRGPRSGSSSSNRPPSPGKSFERWEMPFQFKCIGTLRGHKDIVWCMTTRKGRLYSGGADGIIKIWSLEQLAKGCISNIQAHKNVIHCMGSWGNTLITAGADKVINFWDLETDELKSSISDAHDNIICSMVVHEDLLFTSAFSVIKIWDLKSQSIKATLTGTSHWVRALAISKSKDKLYSGSHNAIHIWDVKENFDLLATIDHDCGSVYSLAITRSYIIAGNSGTYNKNIQLFNVETHEFVTNLCGHIGTVTTVVTSPSGRFLFSSSQDSNIQMWSLEKLLPIQTLSRHQGSVNTLTLHGDFLLSGSEDHEVKVFRYFQIQ